MRTRLSRRAIPWFVRHYKVDLDELACALSEFASLGDFFARSLKAGARPIEEGIVSPVDGCVSEIGRLTDQRLLQVKGRSYSLVDLLQDEHAAKVFTDGHYATLYLSPRDYHRVHAPIECVPERLVHVPGTLFPVNALSVAQIDQLFVKNERTITYFQSPIGKFALVMVGAAGVRTICLRYANRRGRGSLDLCAASRFEQGDELGHFALGSTVIVLFPAETRVQWTVQSGDCVRMGQKIGEVCPR
ncbi:phosphatidylserine decarboxylase [Alicyclobacillus sacchari]|uniref:phosphatidylserine decarboxylase n=1 Tax=Alicyclobacillus sacchari TaxID=392010 RepID=A0A4R8LMQ1_9BACL|nr:archaetidylserine decarboxylase [Alicyclobacillus sacchari]TDY46606.1 phosphatidylserine decarboxylase [Alicyclobacillus sacchari]GMA58857.1 phosphatidylserine decarboxylase proenzyme [Alicyclobacillus sacchari]